MGKCKLFCVKLRMVVDPPDTRFVERWRRREGDVVTSGAVFGRLEVLPGGRVRRVKPLNAQIGFARFRRAL